MNNKKYITLILILIITVLTTGFSTNSQSKIPRHKFYTSDLISLKLRTNNAESEQPYTLILIMNDSAQQKLIKFTQAHVDNEISFYFHDIHLSTVILKSVLTSPEISFDINKRTLSKIKSVLKE